MNDQTWIHGKAISTLFADRVTYYVAHVSMESRHEELRRRREQARVRHASETTEQREKRL